MHRWIDREPETEILRQSVGQHTYPGRIRTHYGTAPRIAAVVSPVTIICRQVSCTRFLVLRDITEGEGAESYPGHNRGGRELPELGSAREWSQLRVFGEALRSRSAALFRDIYAERGSRGRNSEAAEEITARHIDRVNE